MGKTTYLYIPNYIPAVKAKLFEEIGLNNGELYEEIPENLRFKKKLN